MKILFLLIFLSILYPTIIIDEKINIPISQYSIMNGNSLMAISALPNNIQTHIYASKSDIVNKLIQCESGGIHDKWGDLKLKYPVYGILQYQERSFKFLAKESGMKYLDWKNEQDQIWLLKWVIENEPKYLKWWSCYK